MNYITLHKFLTKIAQKKSKTPDFHKEFLDVLEESAAQVKAMEAGYAIGIHASAQRPAEQAQLLNAMLTLVRQKGAVPGLTKEDENILMEYERICQLALLEKPVKNAIGVLLENTLTEELATLAQEIKANEGDTDPIAKSLGLRLDTLSLLNEFTQHFAHHRKLLRDRLRKARQEKNQADFDHYKADLFNLNNLQGILLRAKERHICLAGHDSLINQIEKSSLYGMCAQIDILVSVHRSADDEARKILNTQLRKLFWLPQQDVTTANRLYICLLEAKQRLEVVVQGYKQQIELARRQSPDDVKALEEELKTNGKLLEGVTGFLGELSNCQGSDFKKGLQNTKDQWALLMIVNEALVGIGNDQSLLYLRGLLLKLKKAAEQVDETVRLGVDGMVLGASRSTLKKLLLELMRYEKTHASFFKNPFSSSRKAVDKLAEDLKKLRQESTNFKTLFDEFHYVKNDDTLSIMVKDKVESGYKEFNLAQQLIGGLCGLKQTWQLKYGPKLMTKHHIGQTGSGKAQTFQDDIETLVSATQTTDLPAHLQKIVSLTHYGVQEGQTISDKMLQEAVFRRTLIELTAVTNYKDVDGQYVSHKKGYATVLKAILAKTKKSRTPQMNALVLATEFDANCMTFRNRSKHSATEQNNWANYIRDELSRISQSLGEKIPDSLRDQYPGKEYYDGDTVIKAYAKFILEEERKLSLHDEDYSELKKLVHSVFDCIKEFLPKDYKEYIRTLQQDTKRAKAEGEKIDLATVGERIHYIAR